MTSFTFAVIDSSTTACGSYNPLAQTEASLQFEKVRLSEVEASAGPKLIAMKGTILTTDGLSG